MKWYSVKKWTPPRSWSKCMVSAINKFGRREEFTAYPGRTKNGVQEFNPCEIVYSSNEWEITHFGPLPKPPKSLGQRVLLALLVLILALVLPCLLGFTYSTACICCG